MTKFKKNGIIFEPSIPYSQEQNRVLKQIRKTIINMIKAIMLKKNIEDKLWPKLVLAITYIKNN